MLQVAVLYPELFAILGTCVETRTLTKALESALSDRQSDKSYGSI